MIKKVGDKWLAECVLCSWRAEEEIEVQAEKELSRHMDVVHKKAESPIQERSSPVTDDVKQGNLPEGAKLHGITKKR